MPTPSAEMLTKLRPLLTSLRKDLVERARAPQVAEVMQAAHEKNRQEQRTADPYEVWMDDRCAQVAAAWVLSCIFVRTLEDRDLLERRRIAGDGAEDSEEQFLALAPFLTARDYLLTVFKELSRFPGVKQVFDARHNPVWILGPSANMASELLKFFRQKDAQGALALTFSSEDTRLLGDLYQDLYEDVRAKFALLQTPDFVEEFILDETLEPAIKTFGLGAVKLIDPTCGSGHFLLGAYKRLFQKRCDAEPSERPEISALRALEQVAGTDINPYAVAIARFRLTLAFLGAAGIQKLSTAPEVQCNLCAADSLLFGLGQRDLASMAPARSRGDWQNPLFLLEDADEAERILGIRYQAVVGNPPYITEKDAARRERYRANYQSAVGKFALSVVFTERFFIAACEHGFVGMINANSFMKREFGKGLVEMVLPRYNLTAVVDAAGAYIPGHGTPTALLFGRNEPSNNGPVTVTQGIRGEPQIPKDAASGLVWSGISQHHGEVGFENEYISVALVPRETFARHPWSLGGGGASELKEKLESASAESLSDVSSAIGVMALAGTDEVFVAESSGPFLRGGVSRNAIKGLVAGESVRDWSAASWACIFPYDDLGDFVLEPSAERYLWNYRSVLASYVFFGKVKAERGMDWREWGALQRNKLRPKMSITYAEVATHNHFVLDRGGRVMSRTAPVIKLKEESSEDDHLALLGFLNSSSACFWLNQVSQPKHMGNASGANATPFLVRRAFDGAKVSKLPIPSTIASPGRHRKEVTEMARALDALGRVLGFEHFSAILATPHESVQTLLDEIGRLTVSRVELRRRAVLLQEALDWEVYAAIGLVGANPFADVWRDQNSRLSLGSRPFEIHIARTDPALAADWGRWHLFTPRTEVCEDSIGLKDVVERAAGAIAASRSLQLLESPVSKRRWLQPSGKAAQEPMTDEAWVRRALPIALLDSVEDALSASGHRVPQSAQAIAELVSSQPSVASLAGAVATVEDNSIHRIVGAQLDENSVPFASAYRYTESGMAKRADWERTWALQRQQDAGTSKEVGPAPQYGPDDFLRMEYYQARGKLDVPKERFISYPNGTEDGQTLYGWAGWDHLQQATALAALYQERKSQDGWGADRLTPFLAGLLELVPWLKQWHNEPSADFGGQRLGDFYSAFVESEARNLNLTLDALRAWRPERATRGRRAAAPRATQDKPTVTPEAVLAKVDELAGDTGVDTATLVDAVGAPKTAVTKVADALVEQGLLVLTSKRPKRYARVQGNIGGSNDLGA